MPFTKEALEKIKHKNELKKIIKTQIAVKTRLGTVEGSETDRAIRRRRENNIKIILESPKYSAEQKSRAKLYERSEVKLTAKKDELISLILQLQDTRPLTKEGSNEDISNTYHTFDISTGYKKSSLEELSKPHHEEEPSLVEKEFEKVEDILTYPKLGENMQHLPLQIKHIVDIIDKMGENVDITSSEKDKQRLSEITTKVLARLIDIENMQTKEQNKKVVNSLISKIHEYTEKHKPQKEVEPEETIEEFEKKEKKVLSHLEMLKQANAERLERQKMKTSQEQENEEPAKKIKKKRDVQEAGEPVEEQEQKEEHKEEHKENPMKEKQKNLMKEQRMFEGIHKEREGTSTVMNPPSEKRNTHEFNKMQEETGQNIEFNPENLQSKGDKNIGNVRSIGFLGPMESLAKEDDVLVQETERQKSLRTFVNFRWVSSLQNSKLGRHSPFQRMQDIENYRRYSKCFMPTNKVPKKQEDIIDLEKIKKFNQYELVPAYKISAIPQPATEFSFKTSDSKFARKIGIDEKQFADKKLYNFDGEGRPNMNPHNPFSASYGMERYDQSKRNQSNKNNALEYSSVMYLDDPLKRKKKIIYA